MEAICLEEGYLADIPEPVIEFVLKCLTIREAAQICERFQGNAWHPDSQLMWTGLLRDQAQRWADEHGMQTLTTAMGPLMDSEHPSCLKAQKSAPRWSKYVKGASALFAYYISRGRSVIVLSPPPPVRFHLCGGTNYQENEEPILKRGGSLEIEMVHPSVEGAESFRYQIWPVDMSFRWVERIGTCPCPEQCWRSVKASMVLRFNENRGACPCNSTPDVPSVQVVGCGLDVAGSVIRGPVARLALRSQRQERVLSQKKALGKTVVKKGAVEEAVEKKAVEKKAVKRGGSEHEPAKKSMNKVVKNTTAQKSARPSKMVKTNQR